METAGVIVTVKKQDNGKIGLFMDNKRVKQISERTWNGSRNKKSAIIMKVVHTKYPALTLYGWIGYKAIQ